MTASSKRVLLGGTLGLAGAAAMGSGSHAAAMGQCPNILCLVSQDNSPFIGAYGEAARPALPLIRRAAARPERPGQSDYLTRLGAYLVAVLEGSFDPRAEAIGDAACAGMKRSGPVFMGPPASAGWPS